MVRVKPFAALRPDPALAEEVAARPYDVMSSEEAAAEAGEKSLLHITRPEIDFNPIIGEHDPRSYDKAVENFRLWQQRGWLKRDSRECYYLYAQTMGTRTQYGFVLCAHTEDYEKGIIKKHELTRKDKEDDRMVHVRIQRANIEPVFFSFKENATLSAIIARVSALRPENDFVAEDGFRHQLWVISDKETMDAITTAFTTQVDAFYVADGHHRTAAAARIGAEERAKNPCHTGQEEYNWFMTVCFPEDQLHIMDYNRVVKDLNGYTPESFLKALEEDFMVTPATCNDSGEPLSEGGDRCYRPTALHNFSMFLDGRWYSLTAREGTWREDDPIGVLDVTILSERVLDRLLGIKDLRTDNRIAFVGGLRGLGELERRVSSGEMAVAFALYPVSMKQLVNIADKGEIMPPKTTWFEPKLRSGLFIHTF